MSRPPQGATPTLVPSGKKDGSGASPMATSTHLFDLGGHLHAGAPVEEGDLARTGAQGRAGRIHRGAATTHDGDDPGELRLRVQVILLEEGGGRNDAFPDLFTGDAQVLAALRPHRQQDSVVIVLQRIKGEVAPNRRVGAD